MRVTPVRCAPSLKLADEMTKPGFYPPSPKGFGGTGNLIPAEFQRSEVSGIGSMPFRHWCFVPQAPSK